MRRVYNITQNTKFMCAKCVLKLAGYNYTMIWCAREKINCIDNKMFGNERSNEVNARYMADHFWHELSYLQIHNQK